MSGTYKVNGDKLTGLTVYSTLPIGTVIASFTNSEVGFLPCDHSEYNQSDFPQLWAKLQNVEQCQSENEGKFYVPDLRESNLVGVGTSDNEDIVAHDSYVVGEFKDDQFQGHKHSVSQSIIFGNPRSAHFYNQDVSSGAKLETPTVSAPTSDGTNGTPRTGSTTHGKQTGIYYLIKAVDYASLPQNAIDDTRTTNANTYSAEKIEDKFTYSTTEKRIGTWIDGKPLYELSGVIRNLSGSSNYMIASVLTSSYVDSVIELKGSCKISDGIIRSISGYVGGSNIIRSQLGITSAGLIFNCSDTETYSKVCWTIRYTKTTD